MSTRIFCLCLLLSIGCARGRVLDIRNQFLDRDYLASTHVGTPDPRSCGYCGQQLIIRWNLPKNIRCCPNLNLFLKVRLRNVGIREVEIPICRRKGTYLFRLMGSEYYETGGIVTYQVEIRSGDSVLKTWSHQVWTELIELDDEW